MVTPVRVKLAARRISAQFAPRHECYETVLGRFHAPRRADAFGLIDAPLMSAALALGAIAGNESLIDQLDPDYVETGLFVGFPPNRLDESFSFFDVARRTGDADRKNQPVYHKVFLAKEPPPATTRDHDADGATVFHEASSFPENGSRLNTIVIF